MSVWVDAPPSATNESVVGLALSVPGVGEPTGVGEMAGVGDDVGALVGELPGAGDDEGELPGAGDVPGEGCVDGAVDGDGVEVGPPIPTETGDAAGVGAGTLPPPPPPPQAARAPSAMIASPDRNAVETVWGRC